MTLSYISVKRLDTWHIDGQKEFQRRKILLAGQEEANMLTLASGNVLHKVGTRADASGWWRNEYSKNKCRW